MTVLLTTMTAYSQPGKKGTINVEKEDYVYHLKRSDSLQDYKKLVAAKQRDLDTLLARISTLEKLSSTLEAKDSLTQAFYQYQISNLKEQQTTCESIIISLKKEIKRERRKRKLVTAAGIITTGLAIYLGTLK